MGLGSLFLFCFLYFCFLRSTQRGWQGEGRREGRRVSSYFFFIFAVFIILISPSSDTESAEAADGAKDEKDAEAATPETSDEEPVINNNTTKKSVTARYNGSVSEPLCSFPPGFLGFCQQWRRRWARRRSTRRRRARSRCQCVFIGGGGSLYFFPRVDLVGTEHRTLTNFVSTS